MPQYFTHYWKNETARGAQAKYEHEPLRNLGSGEFKKQGVKVGDFLYPITVIDGQLHLLGRMQIGELLPYAAAKRKLKIEIWDSPLHAIAADGTAGPLHFDNVIPSEATSRLLFVTESGERSPIFSTGQKLDTQTMRGVRHLTPESAGLLDSFLQDSPSSGATTDKTGTLAGSTSKTNRPDWTRDEVDLIVADYFEMLRAELLGMSYNKTTHRERLAAKLRGRVSASIEFKHQNISAVLIKMGLPYIDGYKPRGNFQALLGTAVERYVAANPDFFDQLADAKRISPREAPTIATASASLFVPPPDRIIIPEVTSQPWLSRKGRRMDFARRDAENRQLGKLGEQFVVEVEKKRLGEIGRDDLAARVEWVAQTCGDGLGYDVLSFHEVDDREKYVEVKTTGLGKFFPFYVSANEVRCSEAVPEKFHLYRVFDFSRSAHLYVIPGALSKACKLEPIQYRASL